jgi:hypothetical protein
MSKIKLFQDLFRGREDAYGFGAGLCIKEPVTEALVGQHLRGEKRIGIYNFSPNIENGTATFWSCFDIDNHEKDRSGEEVFADTVKIQKAYAEIELQTYIEASRSDESYHIWKFNAEPIPGELERKLALLVAEKTSVTKYEFFPKQDRIQQSKDENGNPIWGYGNYVNIPLNGPELVRQGRTVFLNPDDDFKPYADQFDFLSKVHRHTRAEIETALAKLEPQLSESTKTTTTEAVATPTQEAQIITTPSSKGIIAKQKLNPANLLPVLFEKCAFMAMFKDGTGTHSEELWYRFLTNIVTYETGAEKAYELSKKSPKFDEATTRKKIAHAQDIVAQGLAPHTCEQIIGCEGFSSEICDNCIAKAASPASLPLMLQKSKVDTTAIKREINSRIAEIEQIKEDERPTAISQLIHKMAPLDTIETDTYADILNKKFGIKKRSFESVLNQARGKLRLERQQKAIEKKVAQFGGDNAEIIQEIELIRLNPYLQFYEKKREISRVIGDDLIINGKFYVTPNGLEFYFHDPEKRLYRIGDKPLEIKIFKWYGLNRTEREYEYLLADLENKAHIMGKQTEVYHFAYYDTDNHVLYIDRNDSQVYRLNGKSVDLIPNGEDGILFLGKQFYEPFTIRELSTDEKFIEPILIEPINFARGAQVNLLPDEQRLIYWIWIYSLFFESILPTKPLCTFIGPMGSGKSTTFKAIGKTLFGNSFNVTPITKQDGFRAAICNNYFVAFDNVDGKIGWLNDDLAVAATGGNITLRELYTTNREVTFSPRCFLCLNAREPQFKRDDVVSRLLLFRVETLETCLSEYKIFENLLEHRNDLWSELIRDLNKIIAALHVDNEPFSIKWRMADWSDLGWRIAKTYNAADVFVELLNKMTVAQAEFLLEDDPIAECLDYWLQEPKNVGREITSGELYKEFTDVAENNKIPLKEACSSPSAFGKKLKGLSKSIQNFYQVEMQVDNRNKRYYKFNPK